MAGPRGGARPRAHLARVGEPLSAGASVEEVTVVFDGATRGLRSVELQWHDERRLTPFAPGERIGSVSTLIPAARRSVITGS